MQLQYCTVATEVDVDLIFKLYPDISLWPLYNYRTRPKWLKDVNSNLLYHLTYLLILIELLKRCKSLKDWREYNVIPYFATTWDTKGLLKVVEERNQLLIHAQNDTNFDILTYSPQSERRWPVFNDLVQCGLC